jgi:hypothetical protein
MCIRTDEEASPFPVKLRSVAERGVRGDSSNYDADRSPFPAVKLKSVQKNGGEKEQDDVQSTPFGAVIMTLSPHAHTDAQTEYLRAMVPFACKHEFMHARIACINAFKKTKTRTLHC